MTATPTTTTSKQPTHIAYHVRDSKGGGKGFWALIGSAWAHADGKGISVQIESVPLDGRITLRIVQDEKNG